MNKRKSDEQPHGSVESFQTAQGKDQDAAFALAND
jgi:hypothetical protein